MKFVHYSRQPLTEIFDCSQPGMKVAQFKPRGLWFSVDGSDDGWREWCEAEQFHLECLEHATEIIFHESAKLLRLTSESDIDVFTDEYKIDHHAFFCMAINWQQVAERYDAIIIAPYIWRRRLHDRSMWYYAWDCACGCVWRAGAISKLERSA